MAFSSCPSSPVLAIYSQYIRPGVPDSTSELLKAAIKEVFPSIQLTILDISSNDDANKEVLKRADILMTDAGRVAKVTAGLAMPNLKWIHLATAGFDQFQKFIQESREVPKFKITRMGGTFGISMSEYVVGYIISHERQFLAMREDQKLKQWNSYLYNDFRRLADLTIGIVGAGDIGSDVAKACKSLGMRTIGLVRRDLPQEKRSKFFDEYRLSAALPSLLAESDYICNILPSNTKTKEFFKGDIFSHCKKKPVFINIGRGDCIQENTIIKSLREGWLSGAVIDVTDPEPLPKESKLWAIPEVIITPHVSGYSNYKLIAESFTRNYAKYIKGEPLQYEIDINEILDTY